jgi:hypothetical protein
MLPGELARQEAKSHNTSGKAGGLKKREPLFFFLLLNIISLRVTPGIAGGYP